MANNSSDTGRLGRALFLSFLAVLAAGLGWASNRFQTESERHLADNQFQAIAERALATAKENLLRRRSGAAAVAALYSNLFPEPSEWPFVSLRRYNEIVEEVSFAASGQDDEDPGQGIAVAYFMQLDQVDRFNIFQQEYLEEYFPPVRDVFQFPPFQLPNGSFSVLPPSRYNISAPMARFYGPRGPSTYLMLDLFSTPLFRPMIHDYLEIAEQQQSNTSCGILSHVVQIDTDAEWNGPASQYTHPIFPASSSSQVRKKKRKIPPAEILIFASTCLSACCRLRGYRFHRSVGIFF